MAVPSRRPNGLRRRQLEVLRSNGPMRTFALANRLEVSAKAIPRDMAALIHAGLVENVSTKRGRGNIAVYAITDEGLAHLASSTSSAGGVSSPAGACPADVDEVPPSRRDVGGAAAPVEAQ